MEPGLSVKRTRTDRDRVDLPGSLPDSASMDPQQPHIPRRKRSRHSDLSQPLEALPAAKAAAAARTAYEAHVSQDDYASDPLSSLAAAESESDAELAKNFEQVKPTHAGAAVWKHQLSQPRLYTAGTSRKNMHYDMQHGLRTQQ